MANKLYEEISIKAIADAIRSKNGATATYTVAQMAAAIEAIESGGGGFVKGTITPASSGVQTITHNLGRTPAGVLLYHTTASSISNKSPNGVYYAVGILGDLSVEFGVSVFGSVIISSFPGRNFSEFSSNCLLMNVNEQSFDCALYGFIEGQQLTYLIPGATYGWFAW